jgi:CubicO group peptidase (beta-lactamase class C family)
MAEDMDFNTFVNDIEKNGWNVFGAEVYENGKLIHAWGDTLDCIHELYSATKTVLSVAFGILYDRGLIGLDDPILKYIPEPAGPCWEKVTVRRLLIMSIPDLPFRAEGDNWIRFSLNCDIDPDRREFNYSNICTYLVGVALANILGSDLGKFIEDEIFAPLNITDYEYSRSPEGYFYGASGMKLKVHDLSKFGLLLMNNGVYEGKRIVSEEHVKLATSIQQMNREGGYGFFIWKYRDGFSINGKWKQKCYVLPASGIIVSYLSHIEDDSQDLKESMERNILGII